MCNKCPQKGKKSYLFGKSIKPKWDKYKSIWMRSSWEIKYAKYLDKLGIKWKYESKTFDLGNCTYTPDFYLPEIKTYIEIKGYKTDIFKKKFKLFKKKYPKVKIEILEKDILIEKGIL